MTETVENQPDFITIKSKSGEPFKDINARASIDIAPFLHPNLQKIKPGKHIDEISLLEYAILMGSDRFEELLRSSSQGQKNECLFVAIATGKSQIVKRLLTAGANPKFIHCGVSPILAAVHTQVYDTVRVLVPHVDVNVKSDRGWTPLSTAASLNNQNIVELLLTHGADPCLKTHKALPYEYAPLGSNTRNLLYRYYNDTWCTIL